MLLVATNHEEVEVTASGGRRRRKRKRRLTKSSGSPTEDDGSIEASLRFRQKSTSHDARTKFANLQKRALLKFEQVFGFFLP